MGCVVRKGNSEASRAFAANKVVGRLRLAAEEVLVSAIGEGLVPDAGELRTRIQYRLFPKDPDPLPEENVRHSEVTDAFVRFAALKKRSTALTYESVTVQRDNMEVSISSHEIQPEAILAR